MMNPLGKTHVPLVTWRVNLDVLLADCPQLVAPLADHDLQCLGPSWSVMTPLHEKELAAIRPCLGHTWITAHGSYQ